MAVAVAVANLRDAEGRGGPGVELGLAPPLPGRRPGGGGGVSGAPCGPGYLRNRLAVSSTGLVPFAPRQQRERAGGFPPSRSRQPFPQADSPASRPSPRWAAPAVVRPPGPSRSAVRRWRICGGERAGRGRPWRLAPAAVWRLFLLRGSPEAPGKVAQCGVRARINPVKAGDKVRGSVPAALGRRLAV